LSKKTGKPLLQVAKEIAEKAKATQLQREAVAEQARKNTEQQKAAQDAAFAARGGGKTPTPGYGITFQQPAQTPTYIPQQQPTYFPTTEQPTFKAATSVSEEGKTDLEIKPNKEMEQHLENAGGDGGGNGKNLLLIGGGLAALYFISKK
jgi:hypothetical protein